MNVQIDPAIREDAGYHAAVLRAQQSLDAEARCTADSGDVSASWSLIRDAQGRPSLKVTLDDPRSGRVERAFAPDDLGDGWPTEHRMIRLWGELLQVQSHKLIEEMQSAAAAVGGA